MITIKELVKHRKSKGLVSGSEVFRSDVRYIEECLMNSSSKGKCIVCFKKGELFTEQGFYLNYTQKALYLLNELKKEGYLATVTGNLDYGAGDKIVILWEE